MGSRTAAHYFIPRNIISLARNAGGSCGTDTEEEKKKRTSLGAIVLCPV